MSLRHAFKLLRRLLAWTRLARLVRNRLALGLLAMLGAAGTAIVMRSRRKAETGPEVQREAPEAAPNLVPIPMLTPGPTPAPAPMLTPAPAPDPAAMLTPGPTPDPAPMLTPGPAPDPAAMLTPGPTPDPAPMLTPAPKGTLDASSELQRIKGLGPKSAAALSRATIGSLERLSSASVEEVNRALEAAGVKAPASLATWPARALELLGKSTPQV